MLGEQIEEVGEKKVVQIVMDSAASCVAAGKLVTENFQALLSYYVRHTAWISFWKISVNCTGLVL